MNTLSFTLPWPPSVGGYWRSVVRKRGASSFSRLLLTDRAEGFRKHAVISIIEQRVPREKVGGSLAIEVITHQPDARRCDLDNYLKGALDALVHAGVIEDDSCFDEIVIRRGFKIPGGKLAVTLRLLAGATVQQAFTADLLPPIDPRSVVTTR